MEESRAQHFLLVTSGLHGHINPVRRLAAGITAANPSARVTFSTSVSGHRLMFPSLAARSADVEEVVDDDGVQYLPYSDGYDEGFNPVKHDAARASDAGRDSLSGVAARLAARGRPVTRVVYTLFTGWALDVARAHGVPAALYWIMPAAAFASYHRSFHGGGGVPTGWMVPDDALPTILSATSPEHHLYGALQEFRGVFAALDRHRPKVLVNTFDALEADALRVVPELELLAVGPAVASPSELSSRCDNEEYIGWLDTQTARSVVYVSFGSLVPMSAWQEVEMTRGLEDADRPYLWARKGGAAAEQDDDHAGEQHQQQGMVVEWCDQTRVLSHPAVGCFVTHCGWNSALETVACGVPVVAVPQWTDQPTVAWLLVDRAGVGVRARADDGVVGRAELRRCVETVMGSADIQARAERWKRLSWEAVASGGTSERNLRAFALGLL